MLAVRIFLALSALIWLPYGVFCLIQPQFLAGAAGVAFTSPTGSTEIRAMYGGLSAYTAAGLGFEFSFVALAAWCLRRSTHLATA